MAHAGNATTVSLPPPGTYELDPAHTAVEFVARHILTKVRGRFTDFAGSIVIADPLEDSHVEVQIRAASIQTNQEQRDQHMKSGDFFDTQTWPAISFRSTGYRATGETTFELDGELTVKDITRPVTLACEYLGTDVHPSTGAPILAASARTTVQREDWGLTWNMVLDGGGLLVGKSVDLELEIEAGKVA